MDFDNFNVNAYSSDKESERRPKIFRRKPNYFEEFDYFNFFPNFYYQSEQWK